MVYYDSKRTDHYADTDIKGAHEEHALFVWKEIIQQDNYPGKRTTEGRFHPMLIDEQGQDNDADCGLHVITRAAGFHYKSHGLDIEIGKLPPIERRTVQAFLSSRRRESSQQSQAEIVDPFISRDWSVPQSTARILDMGAVRASLPDVSTILAATEPSGQSAISLGKRPIRPFDDDVRPSRRLRIDDASYAPAPPTDESGVQEEKRPPLSASPAGLLRSLSAGRPPGPRDDRERSTSRERGPQSTGRP